LTASAGIAGWVEFALLRQSLNRRIGATGLAPALLVKLWLSAALSAAAAWGVKLAVGPHDPKLIAVAVLLPYGAAYFALTYLLRVEECVATFRRLKGWRR
jgi:putative peptidoglycan lipid II flippase